MGKVEANKLVLAVAIIDLSSDTFFDSCNERTDYLFFFSNFL